MDIDTKQEVRLMAVITTTKIGEELFDVLRTLIIANKPTYTFDESTITYTLVAAYPKVNPTFPLVVLNEASINLVILNLDGSGEDYAIEVTLDFYAKEIHGRKAVVVGKDSLRATFLGNKNNFDTDNGLLMQEDFWEDSNISAFEDRNQIINTASSLVRFILK